MNIVKRNPIGVCLDDLLFPPTYFEMIGKQGESVIIRSLDDPDSEPIFIDSEGFWEIA